MQFEEERSNSKQNVARSCIQGAKQSKKWNKESDDLKARSHPAEFPIYEKAIKGKLQSGYADEHLKYKPNTPQAEAGISLSLRTT